MLINFNKYLIVFLYSTFPLALIAGNATANVNIILIDFIFIYECLRSKDFNFTKERIFLFLIFIWFFLVVNSIVNINKTDNAYQGLFRSLGFIRFIFFICATKYFFEKYYLIKNKIFYFWTITITFILIDIFFERIVGHNLIGIRSSSPERIASFFGEELIVGAFILGLGFTVSAHLLIKNEKSSFLNKIYSNLFLISIPFAIFISGERSNFIKSLIIFSFFLFFVEQKFLLVKKKTIFVILLISIILSLLFSKFSLNRQVAIFNQLKPTNEVTIMEKIKTLAYAQHYMLAWNIFKENKLLGIGTKNFRYICEDKRYPEEQFTGCTTHPHQIYFEILSEQGLFGFFIFLIFFINIFIKNCIIYKNNKNLYHLMSLMFFFSSLIPLLPSGSFFSSLNASIFWLNFSLMNYFSKKS